MKKILAFALAALMLMSLVGCAGNGDNTTTTAPADTATVIAPTLTEGSVGTAVWNDFEKYMTENPNATPDEIAMALCEAQNTHEVPLNLMSMPVEPGFLTGFSNDITGFESGAVFMPMISSIAFVGYVFEVEDGADVNAFMDTLKTNANPAWNICVEATETMVGAVGNTVFFIMTPGMYADFT